MATVLVDGTSGTPIYSEDYVNTEVLVSICLWNGLPATHDTNVLQIYIRALKSHHAWYLSRILPYIFGGRFTP
jgi:hypothetical protein